MWKAYYDLTKPNLVYGNVFTVLASFLYASAWHFSIGLFLATIIGITLVIASATVINNCIDRDIDRKMARTRERALATGAISPRAAYLYASALCIVGFALLILYVNMLAASIAFIGFVFYVAFYTYAKRASHWGVVVGSIAGAAPIIVGYTAVADRLDAQAFILFLILALWQMPHFYAISIYRADEYAAAGIPVLPARRDMKTVKAYIAAYTIAFVAAVLSFAAFGYAGSAYLLIMTIVGFVWLLRAVQGFKAKDNARWARSFFLFSLFVLVLFSIVLAFSPFLQTYT